MLALATTTALTRKRRKHIDDDAFLAALDLIAFRDAPTIARHMLASGTPATLPTIASRMADYVAVGGVEALGAAGRIEADQEPTTPTPSPTIANDNANTPASVMAPMLHHGCGLELMRSLPDVSIDLVLADLPYGMTGLAIDPKINVAEWMSEMHRVVTDRGAVVAFGAQPFTCDLMLGSRAFDRGVERFFKQALVWEKTQPTGFAQARARHLKAHEDILVFSKGTVIRRSERRMTYNPQGAVEVMKPVRPARQMDYMKRAIRGAQVEGDYAALTNCPRSVLRFAKDSKAHPFAKPVALLEYLIRTYTDDGAVVFDPTMGSGSTGVAAHNTQRRFIGAENGTDRKGRCIFTVARDRIMAA